MCEFAILVSGWMQVSPYILATSRRTQARDAKLGVEASSDLIEAIQFAEAGAGEDTVDCEAEIFCCKKFKPAQCAFEDALTSYAIICFRRASIKANLKIDGFQLSEPPGTLWCDQRPVGADAHDKAAVSRTFKHLPDPMVEKWLTTPKVNLEDLHLGEFVDKNSRLLRSEFVRTPPA